MAKTLFEYFYFKVQSLVKLGGATSDPGLYQFAVITDDGAALKVETGKDAQGKAIMTSVINYDQQTAPRLIVADRAISFDAAKKLAIELQYFQGPKFHIAIQLLWRKVASNSASELAEPLNLKSGGGFFHNSTVTPSVPTANFQELSRRGWKVLDVKNFELPSAALPNPCVSNLPAPAP